MCKSVFVFRLTQGFDLNVEPTSTSSIVDTQDPVFILVCSRPLCVAPIPFKFYSTNRSIVVLLVLLLLQLQMHLAPATVSSVFTPNCVSGALNFSESFFTRLFLPD